MAAKTVFLSYGREPEVNAFVKKLKYDLEAHGFSVWLDIDDIPSGADWHAAIGTGLNRCKALIAVISNKYITSSYCKSELYAAHMDKKLIFPVIVEDVDYSANDAAQGVKLIVSALNWTKFLNDDDYQSSLTKLESGMKEHGLGPGEFTDSGVENPPPAELNASAGGAPNLKPSPNPPTRHILLNGPNSKYFNVLYKASFKEAKNEWKNIGIALNLKEQDLQSMHIVNLGDPGRCYNAMLAKWFESSTNCYFDVFTNALKDVDLSPAIAKIEKIIYEYADE